MPVRLLVAGTTHTPSIDAVLMLFGRETVLARLEKALGVTRSRRCGCGFADDCVRTGHEDKKFSDWRPKGIYNF